MNIEKEGMPLSNHKECALSMLRLLRQAQKDGHVFREDVDWLRSKLHETNLCPADIGTSKEEIDSFHVLALRGEAKVCLRHLRDTSTGMSYSYILDKMIELIKEVGCSWGVIETSEEEVRSFKIRAVKLLLKRAHEEKGNPGVFISAVRAKCDRYKISLEEVGTDNEELEQLYSRKP